MCQRSSALKTDPLCTVPYSKFAPSCIFASPTTAHDASGKTPPDDSIQVGETISDWIFCASVGVAGLPFKEIAEVIGRRLNIPVVSKSREEAAEHFGWFAMFAGIDAPTSSERTRSLLGWIPTQPGLIADIDHPAYFAS